MEFIPCHFLLVAAGAGYQGEVHEDERREFSTILIYLNLPEIGISMLGKGWGCSLSLGDAPQSN